MPLPSGSPVYALMLLLGIAIGAVYWFRASKTDGRLPLIYFGGLAGAFAGAKLAYLLSEGWLHFDHPLRWQLWLSGKSIMGAFTLYLDFINLFLMMLRFVGDRR